MNMKRLDAGLGLTLIVIANLVKLCALVTLCSACLHATEIDELAHDEQEEIKKYEAKKDLPIR
jgi:hypothetical protein